MRPTVGRYEQFHVRTPGCKCVGEIPLQSLFVVQESNCTNECVKHSRCDASSHDVRTNACELYGACLLLEPAPTAAVVHLTL